MVFMLRLFIMLKRGIILSNSIKNSLTRAVNIFIVYIVTFLFKGPAKLPLIVYGSNVIFNWAWPPIFFGFKEVKLALYEIQLINVTAIGTGILFYKVNPLAGLLFVPYCFWLGLATALNYFIWRDNKESTPKIKELKEN